MRSPSPCFIAFLFAMMCIIFAANVNACDEDMSFEESIAEECAQTWFKCLEE